MGFEVLTASRNVYYTTLHGVTSAKIVHVASSLLASLVVLMVTTQDITERSVNFYRLSNYFSVTFLDLDRQ